MALPSKPRKCRHCRQMFQPARCGQNTCSYECSVAVAEIVAAKSKAKREKAERIADLASTKILREKLKRRRDFIKEAQEACNAYVRERDKNKPCISCGCSLHSGGIGGGFDAGHYRSRGAAVHLRFDESNIHGQCKRCNRRLAGNAVAYRVGLISRIGIEGVERIESDNTPRKWTIEELKAIKAHYKEKLKELQRG